MVGLPARRPGACVSESPSCISLSAALRRLALQGSKESLYSKDALSRAASSRAASSRAASSGAAFRRRARPSETSRCASGAACWRGCRLVRVAPPARHAALLPAARGDLCRRQQRLGGGLPHSSCSASTARSGCRTSSVRPSRYSTPRPNLAEAHGLGGPPEAPGGPRSATPQLCGGGGSVTRGGAAKGDCWQYKQRGREKVRGIESEREQVSVGDGRGDGRELGRERGREKGSQGRGTEQGSRGWL